MHRWSVHTCVGGPVHVKKDTLTTWTQPVVPIWHQCRCGCISPKANWAFRDLHGFKIGTRGYVHAATAFHLTWMGLPSCTCASCAGKDGPHTCKLGLIRNGYLPCSQHLPAVTVQMQTGWKQTKQSLLRPGSVMALKAGARKRHTWQLIFVKLFGISGYI